MIIDDRFSIKVSLMPRDSAVVTRQGEVTRLSSTVQSEHTIDVAVNGISAMRLVCSPTNVGELVAGRLFSEGIVEDAEDIELISVCEYGTRATVQLSPWCRPNLNTESPHEVPSCCTGNRVFVETSVALEPVTPIAWEPKWVFELADMLAKDTPMHRTTFGVHSCFLASAGELVCWREDLGRHNAFDKVLGYALAHEVDLTQAMIYSSGRLPVDMVTKAIRAHVPILASKAVPTDQTIRLAREYGLTLICSARPDSMVVFNDPTGGCRKASPAGAAPAALVG